MTIGRMEEIPLSERELLIDYLVGLRLDRARTFLRRADLSPYGTRADLRERLREELERGRVDTDSLILFLDEVEPWGRQHVLVYDPSATLPSGWDTPNAVREKLLRTELRGLIDEPAPLALPDELSISSVRIDDRALSIMAVERRDHVERIEALDPLPQRLEDGRLLEYRAYQRVVSRGIVLFRWDMVNRSATLHISQGTTAYSYDDAEQRFQRLVGEFVPIDRFGRRDLRPAIKELYDQEVAGNGEARSHRFRYRSALGRDVGIASPTAAESVLGEAFIDQALSLVASRSAGRIGNFYWLTGTGPVPASNPIPREQHVVVLGEEGRVHFMTASSEAIVSYVLQRLRALS
jgi:hypothetical protein